MWTAVRDCVLLSLLCLVLYFTGLDFHGVTNWQEAQRVVVAREMQRRIGTDPDALIVPRHHGQAYIAKPPMIYWVTVGLAEVRGAEVELFDLRLAVALAGTLGVLATYVVSRGMLRPVRVKWGEAPDGRHVVAARWAAVFLATGVLYFRSARIGELDILLVPSVVGAVGCIWWAWRRFIERDTAAGGSGGMVRVFGARAHLPALVCASVFAGAAVLTKGPPALVVIALGGYGAVVLHACVVRSERRGVLVTGAAAMGAVVFAGVAASNFAGAGDVVGVAMMGLIGAGSGWMVARLMDRRAATSVWFGLAHTHPVLVLGVGVLAFWWWGSAVSARIGSELAMELAKEQADNDLNIFVPESPLKNIEALAYGCGVGSVVMLIAGAWWVQRRPAMRASAAGIFVAVAWVVLSFCALSLFGKGVARYLTPVWPGVAIVAAAWLVRRREGVEATPDPRRWVWLGATCGVLGIVQTWWYAHGREVFEHDRSPRALMAEVMKRDAARRYASFEFYTPALDYYAGSYVQPLVNAQMGRAVAGGPAWTLEEFVADVRSNGPVVVMCREWSLDRSLPTPEERLKAAGLNVERLEQQAIFEIDNGRTEVRAVRVSTP